MAVMGSVDMGLPKILYPSLQARMEPATTYRARSAPPPATRGAAQARQLRGAWQPPHRKRRQRADEQEQQPPTTAPEGIEPQRAEQGEQYGLAEAPPQEGDRNGRPYGLARRLGDHLDDQRDRKRRDDEPRGA